MKHSKGKRKNEKCYTRDARAIDLLKEKLDLLKKQKTRVKNELCYKPNAELTDFLEERLELLEKQKKRREEEGEELAPEDHSLKRNNDGRKNYHLNSYIFPSMANLIAFFEYVNKSPEMHRDFENVMKELLFGTGFDRSKNTAFSRLFSNAMQWNNEKDPNNFRLILLEQIQGLVTTKITALTGESFKNDIVNELRIIVSPDMMRAWNWVKVYSRSASIAGAQDKTDFKRPLLY